MNSLTPKGNSHMPQVRFKTLCKVAAITLLSAVLVGCTTSPEDVAADAEAAEQQEKTSHRVRVKRCLASVLGRAMAGARSTESEC